MIDLQFLVQQIHRSEGILYYTGILDLYRDKSKKSHFYKWFRGNYHNDSPQKNDDIYYMYTSIL